MNLAYRPHAVVIQPPHMVELLVSVDDHVLRAMIDWPTLNRVAGRDIRDAYDLEQFLDAHRRDLALLIKARLFARGVPVGGQLVLSMDDLQWLMRPAAPSPH